MGLGLGHSARVRLGWAACATTDDGTAPSCGTCVGVRVRVRFRDRDKVRVRVRVGVALATS